MRLRAVRMTSEQMVDLEREGINALHFALQRHWPKGWAHFYNRNTDTHRFVGRPSLAASQVARPVDTAGVQRF
ncbi:MAG: hypothetical protein ACFB11_00710 [Paracoccaceae bacterium]